MQLGEEKSIVRKIAILLSTRRTDLSAIRVGPHLSIVLNDVPVLGEGFL